MNAIIINDDCLIGMKKLSDSSVDFCLTDLPYGLMNYDQDKKINLVEMWAELKRVLKSNSVVALFAAKKYTFELAASNSEWYRYKYVWIKNYPTNFIQAKNCPMSKYEEILIFSKGVIAHEGKSKNRMKYFPQGLKPAYQRTRTGSTICLHSGTHKGDARTKFKNAYHKSPSNLMEVPTVATNYPTDVLYFNAPYNGTKNHPNEKPVDLLEYLIKTYTREGETVLDCTMGSGSTGVAAINTGRNFIGFEIDKKYYDIASERINKALFKNEGVD